MKFISHRGNLTGKNRSEENTIKSIENAIHSGYDVEIDLWYFKNDFYLGHDTPVDIVSESFLEKNIDKLFIHCKNDNAIFKLNNSNIQYNIFTHINDPFTLSSKNTILIHPTTETLQRNGILIMPELSDYDLVEIFEFDGIISDNVKFYKNSYREI